MINPIISKIVKSVHAQLEVDTCELESLQSVHTKCKTAKHRYIILSTQQQFSMFPHVQRSKSSKVATFSRGILLAIVFHTVTARPTAVANCGLCDASDCQPFNSNACVKEQCINCCNTCAKGTDEFCGSVNGSYGICADGYECVVQVPFGIPPQEYYDTPGVCKASEFTDCDAAKVVALNAVCTTSCRTMRTRITIMNVVIGL